MKITLSLGLFVLAVLNFQVYRKERLIKSSEEIFLELAPVDPRSLLQGDYMALNYKIADEMRDKLRDDDDAPHTGRVVVGLDDKRIATYRGIWTGEPVGDDERLLRYRRVGRRQVSVGVDSFFFEEGQGRHYENACYGAFLLDKQGRTILRALVDENLVRIEPEALPLMQIDQGADLSATQPLPPVKRGELKWIVTGKTMPPKSVSGTNISVIFENKSKKNIKLFWVNYKGDLKFYGEIAAGRTRGQNTFGSHTWVICDEKEKPLGYFITGQKDARALIPSGI
jgi:uncharacterized membrane-anchored protein